MKHRRARALTALLTLLALLVSACGSKPANAGSSGATKNSDFLGCEVTDTGGIDDKSFNATAYKGLTDAHDKYGIQAKYLESTNANDFQPNIDAFVQQNCDLIVTVGFLLADATAASSKKYPDQKFAIVDNNYVSKSGKDITYPNVKELIFDTAQGAFLAGYVAAASTKTGKIGTFGGIDIPPVTDYMIGFQGGINYYNSQNNANVKLLGWDTKSGHGLFSGDFENQDAGRRITETLLQDGADIIFPVAGPVGLGAAAAVKDAGNASMIWVDVDGCVSAPEYCSLFITSVEKNMDVAVEATVKSVIDGSYKGGLYTGTLANDGVGIAPYHQFDSKVPANVKADVDKMRQDIIGGKINVEQWAKK